MFAGGVEGPVILEVAVGDQRPELEDGFGAVESPAGAGDVEAVGAQVAAAALYGAGGDRPAVGQGGVVVELVEVTGEVAVAGGDCLPAGGGKAFGLCLRSHLGGGAVGVSGQDRGEFVRGPGLGLAAADRMEGVRGRPAVFGDV